MGLEQNNNENEKALEDKEAENMKSSMKKQVSMQHDWNIFCLFILILFLAPCNIACVYFTTLLRHEQRVPRHHNPSTHHGLR